MKYHIDELKDGSWSRITSNLPSMAVAHNLIREWARRHKTDRDNYSVLITE